MNPRRTASSPPHASSRSRSSRRGRRARATSASAPAPTPVSVPSGAHAGQLTLQPATTRPRTAATPPTAARSSCPRTGTTRSSRLIALPVTRIHARSANPGEPIFRLEGGPGITNMEFPRREPVRGPPRRRARRLPRRRRLVAARLPRGRRRRCSTPRDLLARSRSARRGRRSGRAPTGSRTTASTSPATRSPSAWTTSRPPAARSATTASTC